MDPTAPPRPRDPEAEARLARVQQWVMSALAVTTIGHLCAGLVVAAYFLERSDTVARVGVCLVAGAFGVVGVAGARAIHRKPLLSPWLLVGTLPAVVGVLLVRG